MWADCEEVKAEAEGRSCAVGEEGTGSGAVVGVTCTFTGGLNVQEDMITRVWLEGWDVVGKIMTLQQTCLVSSSWNL
jgi:hypothetical protein